MIGALGDLVEDVLVELQSSIHHASDTESRITRRRGGSAATVAVVAASCSGAARFIGQIGEDEVGQRMLADLSASGVQFAGVQTGRTGTIVVLVEPNGERTMLTDRADASAIAEADPAWLDGLSALHVPFYSLAHEPLASVAQKLIGEAKKKGIITSIDASSVSVLRRYGVERARALIGLLAPTVVLFNKEEAQALDVENYTLAFGAELLVTKNGSDAARLWEHGGQVTEILPLRNDEVVNTTGAGDAFAAGFLTSLTGGANAASAVRSGHATAADHLFGSG